MATDFYLPLDAPPPPPARTPVWSGLDIVIIVIFTGVVALFATGIGFVAWSLAAHAGRFAANPMANVAVGLAGQTAGFLAGFLFAWAWIARVYETPFWRALQWRKLSLDQTVGLIVAGPLLAALVAGLGRLLPIPPELPVDRLFNHQTAWLLMVYGVAVAPFFEEFFFRGLIYPSLKASFQDGMSRDELRVWGPMVRGLGAVGALGAGFWIWRTHLLALPVTRGGRIGEAVAAGLAGVAMAVPAPLLAGAGWIINRLAALRRPELLSIVITGILFGLLHGAQLGFAWAPVLLIALVGITLTALRARTGTLAASWLLHCAYNGSLFVAQYVGTKGFHDFTH